MSSSVCGCLSDQNADGVINIFDCPVSSVSGCTDILACNYKSTATQDNGSCVYPTNCRECYNTVSGTSYLPNNTGALTDGSGILWQNMINAPCGCGSGDSPLTEDAVGKCGGTCVEDVDEDGICDADDPCVSQIGGVKCDPENNVDCPRLNHVIYAQHQRIRNNSRSIVKRSNIRMLQMFRALPIGEKTASLAYQALKIVRI